MRSFRMFRYPSLIVFVFTWLWPPSAATAQHLLHGASGLDHGVPNFCASPVIRSVTDGAWSDPATWIPARVPQSGDSVLVAPGTNVVYDRISTDVLPCIAIEGSLRFRTDADTVLTVGDLLVRPSGTLEIGTESEPVNATKTARIVIADKPIDPVLDPEQFGTGIVGLGTVRMHGAPMLATFVRTRTEPAAGASTLQLEKETGWQPGDRLVIPDSRYLRGADRASGYRGIELRRASRVTGTSVTLEAPLAFPHPGARNAEGKVDFLPHVGNLSRNVIVASQNPAGTRGHTIFSARANVDIRFVLFEELGRTRLDPLDSAKFDSGGKALGPGKNQIGRYAVHFHHLFGPATPPPSGYQYVLVGNAVDGSSKWGITIHRSHYGLITDNVVYNTRGSAIMTEDGSESFNRIERNFVVRVEGDGNRGDGRANSTPPDFGTEGTGIWLRGPNNTVRDNVVANASRYGYMMFFGGLAKMPLPSRQGAEPSGQYEFGSMPVKEFADNETYASGSGMTIWYTSGPSVLLRTRVWHAVYEGFFGYPSTKTILDGWIVRGDPAAITDASDYSVGIQFGDYYARDALVVRADVQNMRWGILPPLITADPFAGPQAPPGTSTIRDSYLRNFYDVVIATMYFNGGGAKLSPRTTIIRNTRFGPPVAEGAAAVAMMWSPRPISGLMQRDRVLVYDFNQVAGDNFEVFYREQAPDFVVPAGQGDLGKGKAGLTNEENWRQFSAAIGGQITPCLVTRPQISGFVCPMTPSESNSAQAGPPAAPKNPRLGN